MNALSRQIRRFRKEEDGLVMTEFLIMLPLLVWTFMALFIYWDAFRTINSGQKGAYSVSDLISRQTSVDTTFLNGMLEVLEYLTDENSPQVRLRITSVKYDANSNRYAVLFSRSPGNMLPALTNSTLNNTGYTSRIPIMADQHSVVIVETEISYDPAFEVGIPNHTFDNFIVTRPRFELQVCLTGQPCPSVVRL